MKFALRVKLKKLSDNLKEDLKILTVILIFAVSVCMGAVLGSAKNNAAFYISNPDGRAAEVKTDTAAADIPNGSLGILNINTASASELTSIHGIGPVKAASVVSLRNEIGRFKSVDDLICVNGIGKAILERMRGFVTVK